MRPMSPEPAGHMLHRLRERQEWQFFAALPKADSFLALVWWAVLLLRGVLPALFAVAMGVLVAAVQRGESLAEPLTVVGVIFVLLQVLTPIHHGHRVQPRRSDRRISLRPVDRRRACARRAWGTSRTRHSWAT